MDRRFFHRLGASLLDRTICAAAGKAGWGAVIGASVGMDVEQYENSRLILIWGSNAVTSNLHFWTRAQEAKRRGARLVAIDPYRSATAEKCHEHVALMPGTDAALAYGMMHVLIAEKLVDRDYVDRYTVGFDALAARAAEWPPERVAHTCGIPAEQVVRVARDYGTIKPAAIRVNYGMQRVHGGGNAMRAVACLPALVGAWRDPAGGALLSSSGTYPVDGAALERPDLIRGTPRTINMSAIGDALVDAKDPPVRAIYVYNSNPVAVAPDSGRVVKGFARDDLFCVVHEIFQTDTADYADILLPATTQLEQIDIHSSYGHLYALANNPAIAPLGEALPNTEVFRRLAARMGFDEPCFRDTDDELARMAYRRDDVRTQGWDWESLKRDGWQRLVAARCLCAVRARQLPDAVRQMRVLVRDAAGAGRRSAARGHPAARVRRKQSGAGGALPAGADLAAGAQLPQLVVREPAGVRRRGKIAAARDPSGRRGSARASPRAMPVRIFNDRGSFLATARVTDRARPGVVVAPSIWWRKLAPGGENANAVTSQALTDLGRAATFYDCLVEVERR